ncbi:desampylase [Halopenitus sp. H-Gu1]|uniref:desampylase n=1 Tax=Halopenitus sp. H-Gu1 TaxID=3242697 RepID=UPI00359D2ABE
MIEFTRSAYDDVVNHAYDGGDEERCGVLVGDSDPDRGDRGDRDGQRDRSVVTETYPTENAAERPRTRYLIDPEELFEIIETVEASGHEVVGFYHSHPNGPPHPSETDAERATWPDHSYVICALDGQPFVGSWRWRGDDTTFEQETVAVGSAGMAGTPGRR